MILPTVELNFTSAVLDSRVTFTRTTGASNTATYVGSDGYIALATDNQPRFDYNPITSVCKGLLIEESKSNLTTNSAALNSWTTANCSVAADSILSPDNTTSGDKFIADSTTNVHRINSAAATLSANTAYTATIYAKAGGHSYLAFGFNGSGTDFICYSFDLVNGTVGQRISAAYSSFSASITAMRDGWYRCSVTATTSTANLSVSTFVGSSPNATWINASRGFPSFTGNSLDGVFLWGAQLEAGAFATSYIPTTSAALTRNADDALITGANFSSFWQAGKGGVLVRALPSTVSGTRPLVQFDDNTGNNIIALRGNTTNPELYIVDGGAPQAQIDAGTIAANTAYSLTGWWAANDCKARKDSGAVVTDTTATIPTVTQARLGSDGTNYLNGHLATINYYDQFSSQIYTRRKNKAVFTVI